MTVDTAVYGDSRRSPLSLRIFHPTSGVSRSTAVLHLHGGGWRAGAPEMLTPRSASLAARGYTVIQVQYRLLNESVQWPAPIADVRSALRWVWRHAAELGVRTDTITLWGHSAGAHIALMTAATLEDDGVDAAEDDVSIPLSVSAVIDCYGPVGFHGGDTPLLVTDHDGLPDFEAIAAGQRPDGRLPGIDLLGRPCTEREVVSISPVELLAADFPPTLLVHGTNDKLIAPVNSQRFAEALRSLDVVCQLSTFVGCTHEFDNAPSYTEAVTTLIDVFLRRVHEDFELAAEIRDFVPFP